ncbi:MAG: alpha/beta fold hydrolase [Verrucomicrobiae bacterium]|nr:alpha/beta fold hydrolase [Verrucomicrobiae bacterium]
MSEPTPILALHGNLGSTSDWNRVEVAGLKAVDLWDHSEKGFHEFAEALAGPLSEGMEKPILAGYSLGGRLALHALAAYPERWSGAVILAAHPGLCCVEDRMARRSSDAVWARWARELSWPEFLDRWNDQPLFEEPTRDLIRRQKALEPRREAVAAAFDTWSLGGQEDLRASLGRFSGPIIWLTGERDGRFTQLGEEMAAKIPAIRHVVVPDNDHRVLEACPERVADALRELTGSRQLPLT